jgi:membrane fusion protein (multidrug efflux system)
MEPALTPQNRRGGVRWIVFGAAGLLVAAAVWLNASSPEAEADRTARQNLESAGTTAAPPVLTVDAHAVRVRAERAAVDVAGILSAARAVEIAAEVEGRVISVDVGDHEAVTLDQAIVRLDPALPQAAVRRSEAALLRGEAADRLAQAELKRQSDLASRGVASGAELDRAESEAKSAAAQVAEHTASLIDARTRLTKTKIRAPFAGIVGSIDVDPGAYVRPGDRITDLADLSEIEIAVGVSEFEVLALRDGDDVRVSVAALPGESFAGRISRRGRIPDARTRKYPVPVRVANADGRLLPGMLGTVHFETGDEEPTLRIPARAVVQEFDLELVYVLRADPADPAVAVAERRSISSQRIGFRPDLVEVTAGLSDGERIAISGVRELRDGLRVRARDRRPAEMAGSGSGS